MDNSQDISTFHIDGLSSKIFANNAGILVWEKQI
jgi:hypothetical protein